MNTPGRRIGSVGTACRVIVALGLFYLAVTSGGGLLHLTFPSGPLSWSLRWHEAALGLIVLPGVMIMAGLAARRFAGGAVHLTGPLGLTLNTAVIVGLLANPYTANGAELFYGITLLAAAWRGQPGCEATVLSNLILGRDDQIGCPAFSPIDALEARHTGYGQPSARHTLAKSADDREHAPQARQHAMTTSPLSTATRNDHGPDGQFRRRAIPHLAVCLTAGVLIMVLILAINRLG